MEKYFFTFGSDPRYPFGRNDYVMVEAENGKEACELFRSVHPDRPGSNCINRAFIYPEHEFNTFRDRFYPWGPIQVIRKEGVSLV